MDNCVLIIGGYNSKYLNSTEIYNISTRTFTQGPNLKCKRYYATATSLPDGKVLVCGGHDGSSYLKSTEVYDPKTNSFSDGPDMLQKRCGHAASSLLNGNILISGGENGGSSKSTEIYDWKNNKFVVGWMYSWVLAYRSFDSIT